MIEFGATIFHDSDPFLPHPRQLLGFDESFLASFDSGASHRARRSSPGLGGGVDRRDDRRRRIGLGGDARPASRDREDDLPIGHEPGRRTERARKRDLAQALEDEASVRGRVRAGSAGG